MLTELEQDRTVYLIEGVEGEEEFEIWLRINHQALFEDELYGWYTDPKLWPSDRSLNMMRRRCSFELHTVVVDTGQSPLEDDDT